MLSGSPLALFKSNMQQQPSMTVNPFSYNDRPQVGIEIEFGTDPASGAIFSAEGRKHDDLKQMLDSNKDGLKLEAMKRIIGMIARGRDASELFPAVVKNVVSKNIEVKKLVYVYLVRYAEEQQDLALLSISTFQRALKDPNQLIRGSALRVLSSIRVGMIVPIVMLAIQESASDMSPYVRKTAAHAIPKLYSLDSEQKDELINIIEKLLSDRTTLVVGSAVMAFEEVCPERVDLIHKNYRKLCSLLVDVDEWGQVIIINMLTRYARNQFVDPNADEAGENEESCDGFENFYNESSGEFESNDKHVIKSNLYKKSNSFRHVSYHVDLDYRLLLRQTKPLLQSRNASVVMAVAQLYHHLAPRPEVQIIAKALIRLLRSHKEVQSVVLTCIASMTFTRKTFFEPHIKSFFVRTSDPTHIKLLKLDILTNLASVSSISLLLREFQTYISNSDRSFVAATIQAIGSCAATIKEVTETCLSGLVHLLSNRDECIVAESVVVIKKLLQTKTALHYEIVSQMANLLDYINVSAARASIIWLIGEYNEKIPKIAPDVLRKMAKSFIDEENSVKLQILNLGVKLCLTNPVQTSLVCQYVFTLARYDANYDVRDRARFLRQFIFPSKISNSILSGNAGKVFLTMKPAPSSEGKYKSRDQFQLGSLSHYMNMRANGYNDLPVFPKIAPDSSVRHVDGISTEKSYIDNGEDDKIQGSDYTKKECDSISFSEAEKSSDCTYSSSNDESSSSTSSEESRGNEINSSLDLINDLGNNVTNFPQDDQKSSSWESETSDSDSSSSSQSDSSLEIFENEEIATKNEKKKCDENNFKSIECTTKKKKCHLDLLLHLDDVTLMSPIMTPSLGTPTSIETFSKRQDDFNDIELIGPSFVNFEYKELLNKVSGHGLQVSYRFSRSPHIYSSSMASVELKFVNLSDKEITGIHFDQKYSSAEFNFSNDFGVIEKLSPLQKAVHIIGIDFKDSTHGIEFEILSSSGKSAVILKAPFGELLRSVKISDFFFKIERTKLRGMNEHQSLITIQKECLDPVKIKKTIFEFMNVGNIVISNEPNSLHFVGQTLSSKCMVLITIEWSSIVGKDILITVNCEKMVIGSMVLSELRNALSSF